MSSIREVAAAGVSITTVSKVFNNYPGVREATKKRVLSAASTLGYTPNRSAVQLVSGRSDTIGFLLASLDDPSIRDEFLTTIINGVHRKASDMGLNALIFSPKDALSHCQNYVQFCKAHNLAGLIVFGLDGNDPDAAPLCESDLPVVFVDTMLQGINTSCVHTDNETASRNVTEKCLLLGHRDILFVSGSEHAFVSTARKNGYLNALEAAGIDRPHIVCGDFLREVSYRRVKEYIFEHPEITAIFCASDYMAIGAIDACLDLNYSVPADISIIGFDNLSYCEYIRPRLTTVEQDFYQAGIKSVEVLMRIASGEPYEPRCLIPYRIVLRDSLIRAGAGTPQ